MFIGDALSMSERVIVASAPGVFRPADDACVGAVVYEGEVVGVVASLGHLYLVECPFRGVLMGMLAGTGERVRKGQPVAWLRADEEHP